MGISRAESHPVFAGGAEPNTFLEELPVTGKAIEPSVEAGRGRGLVEAELPFTVSVPEGPIGETPHSLMDESVFKADSESGSNTSASTGGIDFGQWLHAFAEAYALDGDVSPSDPHQKRVAAFLDGLDGELHAEQPATLRPSKSMASGSASRA